MDVVNITGCTFWDVASAPIQIDSNGNLHLTDSVFVGCRYPIASTGASSVVIDGCVFRDAVSEGCKLPALCL